MIFKSKTAQHEVQSPLYNIYNIRIFGQYQYYIDPVARLLKKHVCKTEKDTI